jgi:hypothetical protein
MLAAAGAKSFVARCRTSEKLKIFQFLTQGLKQSKLLVESEFLAMQLRKHRAHDVDFWYAEPFVRMAGGFVSRSDSDSDRLQRNGFEHVGNRTTDSGRINQ